VFLNNVVIGYSADSVAFAFVNGYHHIQTCYDRPFFFDKYKTFSLFGTKYKREIWRKIKSLLAMLSLNVDFEQIERISIVDNQLSISSGSLVSKYDFGKCFIFESERVQHENEIREATTEEYYVVDDFKANNLGKDTSDEESIITESDFVSEIHFYNSLRIDGSKYATDIICCSKMTKKQLYNFEYSDTIVGFKTKHILLESNFPRKLKLEHVNREVYPIQNIKYKNSRSVKFLNDRIGNIFANSDKKK
tara:strand:+ start:840 stop:1586 length:747 start_codon:yes stop_codon:yes gene_type:complete